MLIKSVNSLFKIFKLKKIVFLLLVFFSVNTFGASILYRVQLGTHKKEKTPATLLNKSFVSTFTLPQEYNAYFSGGYFKNYLGAKLRLQTMKENSFPNAILRVFKNGNLLSIIEGQKYIAEAEEELLKGEVSDKNFNDQIYSLGKRVTLKNRMVLFDEIDQEVPSDSVLTKIRNESLKQQSVYKKIEFPALSFKQNTDTDDEQGDDQTADFSSEKEEEVEEKEILKTENIVEKEISKKIDNLESKEIATEKKEIEIVEVKEIEKEEEELAVANSITEAKEEEKEIIEEEIETEISESVTEEKLEEEKAHKIAEELIVANEEALMEQDFKGNTEIPFFKIYLGTNLKNGNTPLSIERLPEIVYVYDQKKSIIYTVGYFGSSKEATNELGHYLKQGFDNAKVVALYKGIIISKEVADYIIQQSLEVE
jgi:hypothetical protein